MNKPANIATGIFLFVAVLITVTIMILFVISPERKMRENPDSYSKCLVCHEICSHKNMTDLGGYVWVCDADFETNNCLARYPINWIREKVVNE